MVQYLCLLFLCVLGLGYGSSVEKSIADDVVLLQNKFPRNKQMREHIEDDKSNPTPESLLEHAPRVDRDTLPEQYQPPRRRYVPPRRRYGNPPRRRLYVSPPRRRSTTPSRRRRRMMCNDQKPTTTTTTDLNHRRRRAHASSDEAKCEAFMEKNAKNVEESRAADSEGQKVLEFVMTGFEAVYAEVASAALGPFGGPLAAMTGLSMFWPDDGRIENLQEAVRCLDVRMKKLENRVQELEAKVGKTIMQVNELRRRPLLKMVAELSILTRDHAACAKFLTCARSGFEESSCFLAYNQDMYRCNANAFSDRIRKDTHYNFLREVETEEWNQKELIQLAFEEEPVWQAQQDMVIQYVAVLAAVKLNWSSLEEWAGALCAPVLNIYDVCDAEDSAKIRDSLTIYQKEIMEPVSTSWVELFKMLKNQDNSQKLENSPVWEYKPINCRSSPKDSGLNHYWKEDGRVTTVESEPVMEGNYDCTIPAVSCQECLVQSSNDEIMNATGCIEVTCKSYKPEDSCIHECGWVCPSDAKFQLRVRYDPMYDLVALGVKEADSINQRRVILPPYMTVNVPIKTFKVAGTMETQPVNQTQKAAVRCCSGMSVTNCKVENENEENYPCVELNLSEAMSHCKKHGFNLCSQEQFASGCASSTGCGFNSKFVWSSTIDVALEAPEAPVTTTTATTGAVAPETESQVCNTNSWPDKDHGRVCGPCKVLVDRFDSEYGSSCSNYCRKIQRECVGQWEEVDDTCEVKYSSDCSQTIAGTSDAICECNRDDCGKFTTEPYCGTANWGDGRDGNHGMCTKSKPYCIFWSKITDEDGRPSPVYWCSETPSTDDWPKYNYDEACDEKAR